MFFIHICISKLPYGYTYMLSFYPSGFPPQTPPLSSPPFRSVMLVVCITNYLVNPSERKREKKRKKKKNTAHIYNSFFFFFFPPPLIMSKWVAPGGGGLGSGFLKKNWLVLKISRLGGFLPCTEEFIHWYILFT